jgi:hypothetical protein
MDEFDIESDGFLIGCDRIQYRIYPPGIQIQRSYTITPTFYLYPTDYITLNNLEISTLSSYVTRIHYNL